MEKIGIIGLGNMGGAFYKGLIKEFSSNAILACDKNEDNLSTIEVKNAFTKLDEMVKKVETIILAVKPSSFSEVAKKAKGTFDDKLIISIMAGVNMDKLQKKTGSEKVVRSMPNLPVQVGKGMTGWVADKSLNSKEKGLVRRIFASLGNEIELAHEEKIDALTALSGSGPAYFFYLCEGIAKKAETLGFSKEQARMIAETTFVGSARLLHNSNKTARDWKNAVASKGGTTEAALNSLMKNNVHIYFREAMDEAIKRSKELNK